MPPVNPMRWWVTMCWYMALVGCVMFAAPFAFDIDMMNGGGALIMLGILLALTGLISALVVGSQANQCDALFQGENLLVHWKYDPAEWARYAEAELEDETSGKGALLAVVAFISLLIGGIFVVADPENGPIVIGVLFGVVVLCAVVAHLTTRARYRRNRESVGEAYVGREGAYLHGEFHAWTSAGASLRGVGIRDGSPSELVIEYTVPGRHGGHTATVRIPIPAGQEDDAARVAEELATAVE